MESICFEFFIFSAVFVLSLFFQPSHDFIAPSALEPRLALSPAVLFRGSV